MLVMSHVSLTVSQMMLIALALSQRLEVKRVEKAEAADTELASDHALLLVGDLCDHARDRRERRAGEWDMLQVRSEIANTSSIAASC